MGGEVVGRRQRPTTTDRIKHLTLTLKKLFNKCLANSHNRNINQQTTYIVRKLKGYDLHIDP